MSLWIIVCNQVVVVQLDARFLRLTMDYSHRMCGVIEVRLWKQHTVWNFPSLSHIVW